MIGVIDRNLRGYIAMKLIDHKREELWRGTILRFKGKYPFEEIVDFMLVDIPCVESSFAVVCISGYHAGETECYLPKEAKNVSTHSISRSWLIKNWNKWIYPDCPIQDVLILKSQVPSGNK